MKIITIVYVLLSLVIIQKSKAQENPIGSLPTEIPDYYSPDPNSSLGEVMFIKPSPGIEDKRLTPVVADKLIRQQYFTKSGETLTLIEDRMFATNPSVPVEFGPTERLFINANGDTLNYRTATYTATEGSGGIIRYETQANQMGQIVFQVEYVTLSRLLFFERSFLVETKRELFQKQTATAPEVYQSSTTTTYQAYIHPTTNDVQLATDTKEFYSAIGTYNDGYSGYGRGSEDAYMIEKNQVFGNFDSTVYTRHMYYDVNPDTSILQYASFSKFDYIEGIGTADTIKQTFYSRTFSSSIGDEIRNVNTPNFGVEYAPADFVENPNHRFEEMHIYTQVFDASLRFSTYQNLVIYRKNLADEPDGSAVPFNLKSAQKITHNGKVYVYEIFRGVDNELQLTSKTENWYKFEYNSSRIDSMKYWFVSNGTLTLSQSGVAYARNETTDSVVTTYPNGFQIIQVNEYATAYPTSFPNREAVSTKETDFAPKEFELSQNYPNPFNPSTRIVFNLPKSEQVILEVFDITGKKIATLVNEQRSSGQHQVSVDASRWSSGVYVYRLQAGNSIQTRKMLLVK